MHIEVLILAILVGLAIAAVRTRDLLAATAILGAPSAFEAVAPTVAARAAEFERTGTVADGPSQCFPVDEVVWATASLGAQRGGPGHSHGVRVPDCNQAADGALAVAHHDEAQALPEVVRRRSVETFRVHG